MVARSRLRPFSLIPEAHSNLALPRKPFGEARAKGRSFRKQRLSQKLQVWLRDMLERAVARSRAPATDSAKFATRMQRSHAAHGLSTREPGLEQAGRTYRPCVPRECLAESQLAKTSAVFDAGQSHRRKALRCGPVGSSRKRVHRRSGGPIPYPTHGPARYAWPPQRTCPAGRRML